MSDKQPDRPPMGEEDPFASLRLRLDAADQAIAAQWEYPALYLDAPTVALLRSLLADHDQGDRLLKMVRTRAVRDQFRHHHACRKRMGEGCTCDYPRWLSIHGLAEAEVDAALNGHSRTNTQEKEATSDERG